MIMVVMGVMGVTGVTAVMVVMVVMIMTVMVAKAWPGEPSAHVLWRCLHGAASVLRYHHDAIHCDPRTPYFACERALPSRAFSAPKGFVQWR